MTARRFAALLAVLPACDSAAPLPPDADPAAADAAPWQPLVQADWIVEPDSEAYVCALQTVPSELLVRAFHADAPWGTHHTLVTITEPTGPDRVFPCGPGTLSDAMIFASGPGTDDLAFPEGVAIRVPAGKQILLNLHLFNTSNEPLSGSSGAFIQTLDEADLLAEAEVVFAGTTDFALPPTSDATATGTCLFQQDATLLGLWPHMHQHGRHMRVEHHAAEGTTTLHDAPFTFYHQENSPLPPTLVRAGEHIEVTCHWTNSSSKTVTYGESSMDEMCFAGLYRYPASSTGLYCDMPGG